MKKLISTIVTVCSLLSIATSAQAIVIQEYSVFVNSSSIGATSLFHNPNENQFLNTGIDVQMTENLDAEGMGTVSWEFTNNSGTTLDNTWLYVFLDAEIDQNLNTFFNEYGELVNVSGAGADDVFADSWEIDEPGYVFGDIYDNLLDGSLDNSNGVSQGAEDDASLALGFNLGNLLNGASWTGLFETSLTNIGGLSHSDPDSATRFYFNGTVEVKDPIVNTVPDSGALGLLALGLIGFAASKRRR